MTKSSVKPTSTTVSGPASFEAAVKALESNLNAPNPYATAPATETTKSAKVRLGLAHRFEAARDRFEEQNKRSTGVVGFYGRMTSLAEALAVIGSKLPTDSTFTFDQLAKVGDDTFQSHNPDRKKSPNSARVYAQAAMEFLQVLGLVVYSPAAKNYAFTATLRTLLPPRK